MSYNDKLCNGALLRLDTINEQSEVINTTQLVHHPTDAANFTLQLPT